MTKAEIGRCLQDKNWCMNNLWTIVDESGTKMPYRRRPVQKDYASKRHGLDVILKSRQHGFTSETDISILNDCVFTPDLRCGIIAHTLADAQEIFETKVKLPYNELPEFIKSKNKAVKCDACTLRLANGSSIRVAVSFRSATTHRLHVSELGKICAKFPKRAEEIKTGTMPSVHPQLGGQATIEGTAEGGAGDFYDLCIQAQSDTIQAEKEGRELSPLQYKFHFYPWFRDPKNAVSPIGITVSDELKQYFEELAEKGIVTIPEQRAWYAQKKDGAGGLGRKMKREHPSTVEEAFEQSVQGAVYGDEMEEAREDGRIGFYPWVKKEPVYTFWDLGYRDATCVIFVQFIREEIRIIDFYQMIGRGAPYHAGQVLEKPYVYGRELYMPHDVMNHEKGTGIVLRDVYQTLFGKKIQVIPVDRPKVKSNGIEMVRGIFNQIRFNAKTTKDLLKAISFYRYVWDEEKVCFSKDPLHDFASHPADAIQTLAIQFVDHTIDGQRRGLTGATSFDQAPRRSDNPYGSWKPGQGRRTG